MTKTINTNDLSTMTIGDAAAQQAELKRQLDAIQGVFPDLKKRSSLEIRVGEKGYLYITDPSFMAVSKAGKEYQAGLNINVDVAKALFNNPVILAKVVEFTGSDMKTPVNEFNLTA